MTDTTPAAISRDRHRIDRALRKAFAADPLDRMLADYRVLTASDVLRFDVHWLGRRGSPGRIEPLHATDRLQLRPLRILRGFLYRLQAGFNIPCRVEAGEGTARWVKRPGHGFVVDITSGGGVVDGTGRLGGFAWHQSLRRLRDGTLTCAAQDRICCAWGLTSASLPFWRGPSGPFAWLTPDNRFVLADLAGWGCPVLLDAVWRVGGDYPSFSGSAPGSAADAPAILDPGLAVPSPPRVRG